MLAMVEKAGLSAVKFSFSFWVKKNRNVLQHYGFLASSKQVLFHA